MVILTRDKNEYIVTNRRGQKLIEELSKPHPKNKFLNIYGDGSLMLHPSTIVEVLSDSVYDEMLHKKNQDWNVNIMFGIIKMIVVVAK
jgi:hypothetical protein